MRYTLGEKSMSKLYGIGVGPGDPELMTLKAVRTMKESDVIFLPNKEKETCVAFQIAKQVIPELEQKDLRFREFPMTKDVDALEKAQMLVVNEVCDLLSEEKQVAFLTIGDPTIYSTYHYVHRRVVECGFEAEIVSGIPSFCAAAAKHGISLGDKEEQIHIIPGSYPIEDSLRLPGTKIYMKSGRKLKELKDYLLIEQRRGGGSFEVYAISNCGLVNERIYESLEDMDEGAGYLTLIIVKG